MRRLACLLVAAAIPVAGLTVAAGAQDAAFTPVTSQMLVNPNPEDWLMYSRTYDAQRFSPLDQINRQNVARLERAFTLEFGSGQQESIPIVHDGVLYVALPGATVQAIDGATGEMIWEHSRPRGATRTKSLAIYQDMVFYGAPDGFIVALDARTGDVRWETPTDGGLTSGLIVVEGKVISGRACARDSNACYIAAHDSETGREVWRFNTFPRAGEPGDETWGGTPVEERLASPWGLAGGYDPDRRFIYWGIANPMPNTRAARHGGNAQAVPYSSPADLYSNSTVALNPETGELVWYYQHLPGDDWDADYTNERVLARTRVNPDPAQVKWINPNVDRTVPRDVSVAVGEPGGVWVNDRQTGEFLWATPFPFDTPNFHIADIDVETGVTHLNQDVLVDAPGTRRTICYWNTKGYWPMAYHPGLNALFIPWSNNCLDMTAEIPESAGHAFTRERRTGIPRPGSTPDEFAGLAKVDLETGGITHLYKGPAPGQGAVLATAGDVVFWGDLDETLRAFDAVTGDLLWETKLEGPIQNSTITYAVDGKQYLAVLTGEGGITGGLIQQANLTPNRRYNSLAVFALP